MTIGADGTVLGTSFAAPHVSAAAAVLLARHPELTPSQVIWILEHTARRLGDVAGIGRDRLTGFGLLDVTAAVKLADGPARGAAARGRRRAERRRQRRADACRRPPASPTRSPTSATIAGTSTRSTCAPARRCACAPRRCALGGNLGLDVGIFSPDGARSRRASATRAARELRALGLGAARCGSATRRPRTASSRAGHRAARLGRLPPALEPEPRAVSRLSGAEQLVGRHVAQDARGLADDDGARRHVAQHDARRRRRTRPRRSRRRAAGSPRRRCGRRGGRPRPS